MNSNILFAVAVVAIIAVSAVGISTYSGQVVSQPGQYDEFAQCLTESGAVEYGAYWCPNCERQKLMFGNSFQYVNYVECAAGDPEGKAQPELCTQAGITGYPTWVIEGRQYTGTQQLDRLAELTGCGL